MFMEKSLCDPHGKCVFSSRPRRRFADVCNKFFSFGCVKHWNQHWNVFVFFSHISVALNSQCSGAQLRSPGIVFVRYVINGQVGVLNMECLKCFTSLSSSHLCYDINQMLLTLLAALSLVKLCTKVYFNHEGTNRNIITFRILIHLFFLLCVCLAASPAA